MPAKYLVGASSPAGSRKLDGNQEVCHRWDIILAGGDGTRLLPLTRRITGDERPKQFCCVIGRETLLHQTRSRVSRILSPQQTLVVLTRAHESFYIDQVQDVAPWCLLIQPYNRGTAPAILYSLMRVRQLDPEALVAFFPADHHFSDEPALNAHVDLAFREAVSHPEFVILLGISPDVPEAGYGWIQPGAPLSGAFTDSIFRVECFWEKPSQLLARFLMSLGCLWNSFIMVGRLQAFLNLTRRALPGLFRSFCPLTSSPAVTGQASVDDLYSRIPAVNFSQQVLSASPPALAVLRAEGLGWSDLGEPDRVLSVLARKGITPEWNFDRVAGSNMARAAST